MVPLPTAVLTAEVIELLRDPSTLKVLATTDEAGNPHAVLKDTLTILDDGFIAYGETLESSRTNSNVLRSTWFDKVVAVLLCSADGRSYQIKGKPYRYVTTGSLFKQFYLAARRRDGPDSDLAGIWLIAPLEVRNETFAVRKEEEERKHPNMRHLDRASFH